MKWELIYSVYLFRLIIGYLVILLIFLYCYFSNTYKNVNEMGTSMSGLRFFCGDTIISKRK